MRLSFRRRLLTFLAGVLESAPLFDDLGHLAAQVFFAAQ
jgi:hypothetical protein